MKKIFLISVILLILATGVVSASDNVTDDLTVTEDNPVELNEINTDKAVLKENKTWNMLVDDDIEVLPTKNQVISLGFPEDATGNISLSVDGVRQNLKITSENYYSYMLHLEFDASKLNHGQHRYDLNFTGDDIYSPTSKSGTLTVSPILITFPSELYLENTYENNLNDLDERGYIKIQYLKNMTGNLYLYINGEKKTIKLSDYNAKGKISSRYNGYSDYMYYYKDYNLVTLNKNKQSYTYFEYFHFRQPSTIKAAYDGKTIKTDFVNVTYEVDCNNELVKGNDLEIFVPKSIASQVSVKIDGKTYKMYSSKVELDYTRIHFYVKTSSLNYGKHTIKISSPLYTLSKTVSVVDEPISPKIVRMYYKDSKKLIFTVYKEGRKHAAKGEYVSITIGSDFETSTSVKKNGKISVKIPNDLKPGTHVMDVHTYSAPDSYAKVKLVIKHLVTLKTSTVKKSAKKLVLSATLKNSKVLKGKYVTFKFNGKTVGKAKTNSKGIAKITVKKSVLSKLKVGKKVTYQAAYGKDTVKKTATVKK